MLGRDGAFATLWDSQEHRMVVENATEEHCRKVRDQLTANFDGQLAELRHLLDPQDAAFSRMACTNPDACSCLTDYPGWAPGRTA
ncbi:hypothetical protein [Streptomyces sp. WAC05858]|uniref:hypothetical protein n=1 Tax=Streptomyces TaxID=1883 RepID=UPI000F76FBDD|nr:hypothetical protein [Streptomyces sp. WAC05858]RSS39437.1 hypothetical protein EF902_27505 [Streptomyces sp. WAC05858]